MGQVVRLEDHRPDPEPKPKPARKTKPPTRRRFGKIRKLPSGRWQASYIGPDQIRHVAPTTFVAKTDAGKYLALVEAQVITGKWAPPQTAAPTRETFTDYAGRWLAHADLKPRTRDEYRRLLDDLAPTFGKTPLVAITPAQIEAWHAGLPEARQTGNAHRYRMLHRVLQAAVDDDTMPVKVNPAQHPKWGKAPAERPIRPATPAELDTIAARMPASLECAVHVAAWCGVRLGELAELRRKDLDLAAGTIRITRSVQWIKTDADDGGNTYRPVVGPPKSDAGVRTVTVPPHVLAKLAAHVAEHAERGRDGLVFTAPAGGPLRSGSLNRYFGPARKAAGRPDLRWHDLRHTGATFYAQAGATLRESMAFLGHSTVAMAVHYQHVADDRPAALAAKLSAMAGWEAPDTTTTTEGNDQ